MFDPSAPHIIILLIVVLLLFGSRRLPGAAKSLGQSMHIFKKSVAGLTPEEEQAMGFAPTQATMPQALPATQPAPGLDQQSQIQDLQRQVQALQQQTASGNAGQTSQPL
jgi:sec-independent protein translocase protein TatA